MAGDVFLEKKARLRWLGASFSRKGLDSDGWGRISREKGKAPMAGGVFLEKKARLRWLDAYFSRKRLDSDGWGRISREKG